MISSEPLESCNAYFLISLEVYEYKDNKKQKKFVGIKAEFVIEAVKDLSFNVEPAKPGCAELMQKYVIDFDKDFSVYTQKVKIRVQFKLVC